MSKPKSLLIISSMLILCSLVIPLLVQSPTLSTAISEESSLETKFNTPPTLTNANLTPITGDTNTLFTYTVTYSDPDDDAPGFMYVYINGTNYNMTKQDPGDNTYQPPGGCNYTYSTTLAAGYYTYLFSTSDGVALVNSTTYPGPLVTEALPDGGIPWMNFPFLLIPLIGMGLALFYLRRRNF